MTRDIYDRLYGSYHAKSKRERAKDSNYKTPPVDTRYADNRWSSDIKHIGYTTVPPWGVVDVFEFTDGLLKKPEKCILMSLDSFSHLGLDMIEHMEFPDKEEE